MMHYCGDGEGWAEGDAKDCRRVHLHRVHLVQTTKDYGAGMTIRKVPR